jgi:serine/threonine protein kinase
MPSETRPGTVLAGFRIDSLIGEGAMGTVYLAEDTRRSGRVALKVLVRELANDERFRRRFLRESKLAASLDHPNVVRVLDAGEEDGVLYLVMSYIEGSDLREVLRREGGLDPERALDLAGQVAGALDAAHAAGLVHRDVKPGNILITATPTGEHAYVCDFGLARHLSSASSLTTDRGLIGTIDYIPPEQIEGGEIDGRADVYSLGCVLFECLAGARPFDRDSELSVVFAHLNEPPPRLSDLRPELSTALDDVFATALAKSPDERYATCDELIEAARAAQRGETVVRRKRRTRRWILGAVAVLVAAAVAVLGLAVSRDTHSGHDRAGASITPTSVAGAPLGLFKDRYKKIWGLGWRDASLPTPPGYSFLSNNARRVTAYFEGGNDEAVEITTWNRADRTKEGVGPCSTVDELKAAYGERLKPVQANIIDDKVFGYVVGNRLFFAIGPGATADTVEAVAVHVNPLEYAGYLALSEGPCS